LNSDLQHLIQLQELELTADRVRRRIEAIPGAQKALEARIAERTAGVQAIRERIAANQAARRDIEKDLASVQARLSKYKDQLMEVKTNKEYQAMQTEINVAEQNVRRQEDRLLERMEEAEILATELKDGEAALKAEQMDVALQRQNLETERTTLDRDLERASAERARVASALPPGALATFEQLAKHRKGLALSEAREGHCTQCHVRLRPQVFNEVRRNDSLIQCENCSRILYFVPAATAGTAHHAS
jgi:hypothetical protein